METRRSGIQVSAHQTDDVCTVAISWPHPSQPGVTFDGVGASRRAPGDRRNRELGFLLALARAVDGVALSIDIEAQQLADEAPPNAIDLEEARILDDIISRVAADMADPSLVLPQLPTRVDLAEAVAAAPVHPAYGAFAPAPPRPRRRWFR